MEKVLHKILGKKLMIVSIDNCSEIIPEYAETYCYYKPQQADLHIYGEEQLLSSLCEEKFCYSQNEWGNSHNP